MSLFAANSTAWAAPSPALRQLLQARLPLLEQSLWADADSETGEGIACSSGSKVCAGSARNTVRVVQPGTADQQRLRTLVASTVLPRWLARCGPGCAQVWNATLAPVVGVRQRRKCRVLTADCRLCRGARRRCSSSRWA